MSLLLVHLLHQVQLCPSLGDPRPYQLGGQGAQLVTASQHLDTTLQSGQCAPKIVYIIVL